jgi:hypothetical protein
MLWGGGSSNDKQDASRLADFKAITTSPKYIIGFEEPDCSTEGSSSMTIENGKLLDIAPANELIISRYHLERAHRTSWSQRLIIDLSFNV